MAQDSGGKGPLAGLRILEFAAVLAGPYAGELLRLLGAEVIKVESPPSGDSFRGYGGGTTLAFTHFNAGKKSILVDLHDDRGRAAVEQLIAGADALFENSRPGAMARLGLSEQRCHELNPGLVYVSISGFGSVGPLSKRPAYDAVGQAMSGLMGVLTTQGPPSVGPTIGDMMSGIIGANAVLAGLAGRGTSGIGVTIETSMLEAVFCLINDQLFSYFASGAEPDREVRSAQSQIYVLPCQDESYVVLHLSNSQKFFTNLANAIGRPELVTDERFADYAGRMEHRPELRTMLEEAFRTRPSEEWEEYLAMQDVPCGRVLSIGEVVDHPQTESLQILGPLDANGVRQFRGPWRIGGQRPEAPGPAPSLGEHTREVFGEVLKPDALEELLAAGVLGGPASP